MGDFKELATDYVLAGDEQHEADIAAKAAAAIQTAPTKSSAILAWAQSINQWMPHNSSHDGMHIDDGEEGEYEGDVIARAKALSFLADTLGHLDKTTLAMNHVEQLMDFFGAMFAVDHKAGIMAAVKALRRLADMRSFVPRMGKNVLNHVVQLKDDFRLQAPATRYEIYGLIEHLLVDEHVRVHLQHTDGSSSGFMLDLLRLCRHERDPRNLLVWFGILRLFLLEYPASPDVTSDIFKMYSDYFPISMRASTTTTGVTVDDLKSALRSCFAASHLVADSIFDFLIQKLDQGDAITVNVKLDILRTTESCIRSFPSPSQSVAPYASRIWNCLKYEVRNGEAQESIDFTLKVIHALSERLDSAHQGHSDNKVLTDFVRMVLSDSIGDLSNPTYARQSGQLLTSVLGSSIDAFGLAVPRVIDPTFARLRETTSALHARDLISLINGIMSARYSLLQDDKRRTQSHRAADRLHQHDEAIRDVLADVYIPTWNKYMVEDAGPSQTEILKEVMNGLSEFIRQQGPLSRTEGPMLCSPAQCTAILQLLCPCIIDKSQSPVPKSEQTLQEVASEAVCTLRKVVRSYPPAFDYLVREAMVSIRGTAMPQIAAHDSSHEQRPTSSISSLSWRHPSPQDLIMLKNLLQRLAFIGCSTLHPGSNPLHHLFTLTGSLLLTLASFMDELASFQASTIILSGIYSAMLHFRDCCLRNSAGREDPPPAWHVTEIQEQDTEGQGQFPMIDTRGANVFTSRPERVIVSSISSGAPLQRRYRGLGLCIIGQLYRRATTDVVGRAGVIHKDLGPDFDADRPAFAEKPIKKASSGEESRHLENATATVHNQDKYLHQLASMAAFILSDLDESEQRGVELYREPFALFHKTLPEQSIFHGKRNGRLDVLSVGVMQAMYPAIMGGMTGIGLLPSQLINDLMEVDILPDLSAYARNCIATIVSNKCNRSDLQELFDSIKSRLSPDGLHNLTPAQYARFIAIASGAMTRLDKEVRELVGPLIWAPPHMADRGDEAARLLGIVNSTKDYLRVENHAIIKPIYRQWAYAHLVQPFIPLAYPSNRNAAEGRIYTLMAISVLRHTPFVIYGDDAEPLARLIIAGMTALSNWMDVEVVCQVIVELVENKVEQVRDRIGAVIKGVATIYTTAAAQSRTGSTADQCGNPAACRLQAVLLLSRLPIAYDHRHLLPFATTVSRILSAACGDRVRQIREAAQTARENWVEVS